MSPTASSLGLFLLGCAAAACSGAATTQKPIQAAPEPKTEAVLAGPLCHGEACTCRQSDRDAGAPAAGAKRYELRLGPSDDETWLTVDGMVMYKNRDRTDACYYVDLEPGDHKVSLRVKADSGLNAALVIAEEGGTGGEAGGPWWYRTFDFNCGAPGECDLEQVRTWKAEVSKLKGKHDPCGSTKIGGIEWETGRMPDRAHPDDLLLRLTVQVYKFIPKSAPGSGDCDKSGLGGGA